MMLIIFRTKPSNKNSGLNLAEGDGDISTADVDQIKLSTPQCKNICEPGR